MNSSLLSDGADGTNRPHEACWPRRLPLANAHDRGDLQRRLGQQRDGHRLRPPAPRSGTLTLAFTAAWLALGCAAWESPERRGVPRPHVTGRSARTPDELSALLAREAAPRLRGTDWLRTCHVVTAAEAEFPDADQLRLAAGEDPALRAYAALAGGLRRRDLYVFDLEGTYWLSREYFWRGRPARFKTDFLVHVEADGTGTRLEVIEYRPRVQLGERMMLLGHHGPGRYEDVRFVFPTVHDREALLALLLELAGG